MNPRLNRIDNIVYTAGEDSGMPPRARERIIDSAGIPAEKVLAEHDGKPLGSSRQTEVLLDELYTARPDSLNLAIFAGRIDGGWEKLVKRAYEIVLLHSSQEQDGIDISAVVASLGAILDEIEKTRRDFEKFLQQEPDEEKKTRVVKFVADELKPLVLSLHEQAMAKVRERLMLVMMSGGDDYVLAGRVAAELGIIDGAFVNVDVVMNQTLGSHIEGCLQRRRMC